MLHPGQVLGVVYHCFPLPLDVPTFAARCLHVRNDTRDPSSERWKYVRERLSGNFAYMASLFTPLGIFYIPTGDRRLYLPFEGRCAGDFFALRPCLNPRTWVLKASTLPLDHRNRSMRERERERGIYISRKIRFFFTDILRALEYPLPSTQTQTHTHTYTQYSHCDLISDRMGVTSHLQCNWRLSTCNEGVGG